MCNYSVMLQAEQRAQKRFLAIELSKGRDYSDALANSYARLAGILSSIIASESLKTDSGWVARRREIVAKLDRA